MMVFLMFLFSIKDQTAVAAVFSYKRSAFSIIAKR